MLVGIIDIRVPQVADVLQEAVCLPLWLRLHDFVKGLADDRAEVSLTDVSKQGAVADNLSSVAIVGADLEPVHVEKQADGFHASHGWASP